MMLNTPVTVSGQQQVVALRIKQREGTRAAQRSAAHLSVDGVSVRVADRSTLA
jgi:hypothetical protein